MKNYFLNLAIISTSVLATVSCKGPAQAPPAAPVPVNLYQVLQEGATYYDQYPANVIAENQVELRSEVTGFITNIYFQEGQSVRKGQKLYEIERSKYAAASAQAAANLQMAKSNLEKAQADAERYKKLDQQGMTTKQKLEYSETDLRNAQMQVAAAEAELNRANVDLSHASIIAPFDGTIGISMVKKGTFITAGNTLLNTVSSDNPIAVDFVISEKEINRFIGLKDQKSARADSLFTIELPDKTIYPFTGQIQILDRAVDPQTGTLKVRLNFPNPKKALKSGMSCNVRVKNKTNESTTLIPSKAIVEQMGEFFVFVVDDKDTARQHKVEIGPALHNKTVIYSGVKAGEEIVIEGVQKLRDKTPVQIGAPGQAAQPAAKK